MGANKNYVRHNSKYVGHILKYLRPIFFLLPEVFLPLSNGMVFATSAIFFLDFPF